MGLFSRSSSDNESEYRAAEAAFDSASQHYDGAVMNRQCAEWDGDAQAIRAAEKLEDDAFDVADAAADRFFSASRKMGRL